MVAYLFTLWRLPWNFMREIWAQKLNHILLQILNLMMPSSGQLARFKMSFCAFYGIQSHMVWHHDPPYFTVHYQMPKQSGRYLFRGQISLFARLKTAKTAEPSNDFFWCLSDRFAVVNLNIIHFYHVRL